MPEVTGYNKNREEIHMKFVLVLYIQKHIVSLVWQSSWSHAQNRSQYFKYFLQNCHMQKVSSCFSTDYCIRRWEKNEKSV